MPRPESTALHVAVYYGSVDAAITLLELGANPNSQDSQQRTPLHMAVLQSNCFLARLLKSHKADLGARDKFGRQASYYASTPDIKFEMDDPLLQRLIALAQSGTVGARESHVLRHYSRVCGVIRSEECVSVSSGDSWSALMESVLFANAPFTSLLLELGAPLDARDASGLSALFWARLLNRDEASFFGAQGGTCQLTKEEVAMLLAVDDMKKADVRNALLFEINLFSMQFRF
jgi:ankyrin repeat protein